MVNEAHPWSLRVHQLREALDAAQDGAVVVFEMAPNEILESVESAEAGLTLLLNVSIVETNKNSPVFRLRPQPATPEHGELHGGESLD